ncbi:MAG: hypothetical protein CUN56_11625 [Phototrophicales bacterium]|nr:MAG: hypothetical protein CUN56_11625 [Phototrophicales bacterium]RMG76794.1 MAG: hypothetical protein D6711_03095 [Chloroflexota bacterium]
MPRAIWLIILLSLGVAIIIGFDLTPWIRGGYGWRWGYDPAPFSRVAVLLVALLVYVSGGLWLIRHQRSVILWGIVGTLVISYLAVYIQAGDVFHTMLGRTVGSTTAQHEAAAQLDWQAGEWRHWSDYMRSTDGHIALSPPGAILWYGALNQFLNNTPQLTEFLREPLVTDQCYNYTFINYSPAEQTSAWFGVLMPLWASLTIFPLAAIARHLMDAQAARWVVLWWALVPGVAAFASSWNTLYPLLAALAFWMLLRGLASKTRWWLIGAGFWTGLALFTNFAFMPLLGVLGVYTLAYYWRDFRRAIMTGIWVGVGVLIPWLIFYLLTGETIFDMLQAALDYHFDLDRPYWFWVGMHLWDFMLWAGVGLTLAALLAFRHWHKASQPLTSLALTVTLIVMALSGTARGETGRVWLFLAPMLLVAAVDGLRRVNTSFRAFTAITASHALLTLVLLVNIPVMDNDFPKLSPPAITSDSNILVNSQFLVESQPAFELVGWSVTQQGDTIRLKLHWRAIRRMSVPYWFSALLISPDGSTTEPILWQPREFDGKESRYPTTCWQPGVLFEDEVSLPLPQDAPEGDWWISLAAFGDVTQPDGRLQVRHADHTTDVQVGLGPVQVR